MKKLIATILTTALMLSLSATAFAATNDGTAGTDIDVNAKYVDTVMVENKNASAGKYGELTLSGNVQMDGSIHVFKFMDPVAPTVKALAGTYNFDVSSYVDTDIYNVTNDGTIWMVTAK